MIPAEADEDNKNKEEEDNDKNKPRLLRSRRNRRERRSTGVIYYDEVLPADALLVQGKRGNYFSIFTTRVAYKRMWFKDIENKFF